MEGSNTTAQRRQQRAEQADALLELVVLPLVAETLFLHARDVEHIRLGQHRLQLMFGNEQHQTMSRQALSTLRGHNATHHVHQANNNTPSPPEQQSSTQTWGSRRQEPISTQDRTYVLVLLIGDAAFAQLVEQVVRHPQHLCEFTDAYTPQAGTKSARVRRRASCNGQALELSERALGDTKFILTLNLDRQVASECTVRPCLRSPSIVT